MCITRYVRTGQLKARFLRVGRAEHYIAVTLLIHVRIRAIKNCVCLISDTVMRWSGQTERSCAGSHRTGSFSTSILDTSLVPDAYTHSHVSVVLCPRGPHWLRPILSEWWPSLFRCSFLPHRASTCCALSDINNNKMSFALVFIKPSETEVGPCELLPPPILLCSYVLNLISSLFTVLRVKPKLKWLEDIRTWRGIVILLSEFTGKHVLTHKMRCVNCFQPWSAFFMRTIILYYAYMNRGKNSSSLLKGNYYCCYYYYYYYYLWRFVAKIPDNFGLAKSTST